jgi:hypothetical protein
MTEKKKEDREGKEGKTKRGSTIGALSADLNFLLKNPWKITKGLADLPY